MPAAATDKFRKATSGTRPEAAYLTGTKTIGASSITVNTTTGWDTTTGYDFIIYRKDVNNNVVAGTVTTWVGTVSGTTISNLTLKAGTDQEYASGEQSVVVPTVTAAWATDLVSGLLVEHGQNGVHALTSSSTMTSPKVITSLNDTNGNELFKVTATGSAVNEFTVANAATGNGPTLSATGGDTNVNINLTPKGSGYVNIGHTGAPVQIVSTNFSAVATGTTIFPVDDTIPQNTEGVEYMTQAITPKSATNILVIEAVLYLSCTVAENLQAGLFQDSTANALAAVGIVQGSAGSASQLVLMHTMAAGTTSSTTFKIRAGAGSANTVTFNGVGGTRRYGAITKSFIKITEYKA